MKRRFLISDNKGKLDSKFLYADYVEYREGNALFWLDDPPPDGKRVIGLFSLRQWHIVERNDY